MIKGDVIAFFAPEATTPDMPAATGGRLNLFHRSAIALAAAGGAPDVDRGTRAVLVIEQIPVIRNR